MVERTPLDVIEPHAVSKSPMNSGLSVRPSVTPLAQDWLITLFCFLDEVRVQ